jgi:hypothetical protein
MISSQKSIVLAGLMIGVLALAVTLKPPGRDELSASPAGFEHDGASTSGRVESTHAAIARSGADSADETADADIAQALQAARYSLQRNDLVSARQLLDAVHALHKDNAEVVALQRSLELRENGAVRAAPVAALPVAQTDGPAKKREAERTASRSPASVGRSHETTAPVRDAAVMVQHRAPLAGARQVQVGLASAPRAAIAAQTTNDDVQIPAVSEPVSKVADVPQALQSAEHVQTMQSMQTEAQSMQPTQAAQAPQVARTDAVAMEPASSGSAPKTRAQVRAELDRARVDGALPRFGNPDPKGPGGAPSTTVPQTALAH